MPLVKTVIQAGIATDLAPLIEEKSKDAFKNAMMKFNEVVINGGTIDIFSDASDAASATFSNEMKGLAQDIAKSVATHVDTYIKAMTVIVPPGQAVITAGSAVAQTGATTTPSSPAIIS